MSETHHGPRTREDFLRRATDGLEPHGGAPTIPDGADRVDSADALREPLPEPSPYVDWSAFWERGTDPEDFIIEDVLAKGRGHAVWARAEQGKSLLTLWLALQAVEAGNVVIYLDWEMTEKDLEDRLTDMGYGPDSDLSRLRYALLPDLPILDTPAGGDALAKLIDGAAAEIPGLHVVVIIDTVGRSVGGPENDNDTWLNFYKYTGVPMKRRGVTWLRLDHTGWEGEHSRGASAKYDDVDVVWELKRTDSGVELHARKRRMPSVPERVVFSMTTDHPLRYERVEQAWPQGTHDVANVLDRLGAPIDIGTRAAEKIIRGAGLRHRNEVIRAAVKYRKWIAEQRVENTQKRARRTSDMQSGRTSGRTEQKPLEIGTGALGAHPGALELASGAQGCAPVRGAPATEPENLRLTLAGDVSFSTPDADPEAAPPADGWENIDADESDATDDVEADRISELRRAIVEGLDADEEFIPARVGPAGGES